MSAITMATGCRELIFFNDYVLFLQIDHDVCSNYGNWLYSAGIGNDPREDRKFNMVKQGLDYDPEVQDFMFFVFNVNCRVPDKKGY